MGGGGDGGDDDPDMEEEVTVPMARAVNVAVANASARPLRRQEQRTQHAGGKQVTRISSPPNRSSKSQEGTSAAMDDLRFDERRHFQPRVHGPRMPAGERLKQQQAGQREANEKRDAKHGIVRRYPRR